MVLAAAWRRASGWLQRRSGPRALILLYHRVGDVGTDPWALAVTPDHLADHLEVLRRDFRVVSLRELDRALDRGTPQERLVAVTFDDGYRETLLHVRTLSGRAGIPLTAFLPAGALGGDREFWWDELERILFHPGPLPQRLELPINGRVHQWELGDAADDGHSMSEHQRRWRAWEEPPGPRQSTYRALYDLLLPLRHGGQREVLDRVLDWAGFTAAVRPSHCWLTASEASTLARDPAIEIGAHTITHPVLSTLPAHTQWEEIQMSKTRLEALVGRPVTSFAYPYGRHGHYTPNTVALVRRAGFARACMNVPGLAARRTDRFQLPRVQSQDWDAEAFRQRLFQWFDRLE